jgi:L-fuculose-phosphate aldolase
MTQERVEFEDPNDAVTESMRAQLEGLEWSLPELITLTCRVLAAENHMFALAGQITVRLDDDTFWTVPWTPAFDALRVSDIIRVDGQLNVVEGRWQPNPATRFHLWVYNARPDVNCIVHTHPPYVSALSMLRKPLLISHMDAMPLYNDVALLEDWPGVPVADHEGELIAGALGDKRAIMLAHHGMLVTGGSVQEAAVLALMMENAARMQVRAQSVGEILPAPPHLAQEARDYLLQPSIIDGTFRAFAERVLRDDPRCLDADA